MGGTSDGRPETEEHGSPGSPEEVSSEAKKGPPAELTPAETKDGPSSAPADQPAPPDQHGTPSAVSHPGITPTPSEAGSPSHPVRKWLLLAGVVVGLGIGGYLLVPWVVTAMNTVSTDDAYVNGHVTFVAPRVAGQVSKVLVDDNYRVKKGDILVQLDKEPYQVQVAIKKAAVEAAEADLAAAQAQVRGQVAQARANRFKLEHAIQDVDNQIANLRAAVATLNSRKAALELAQANFKRGEALVPSGAIAKENLDVAERIVAGRAGGRRRSLAGGLRSPGQPRPALQRRPRARTWPTCRPTSTRTSPACARH